MEKKEKLIIVGHGASGKDYLASELIKLGLKKSITYTTRPKRSGEEDGIIYNFIDILDSSIECFGAILGEILDHQ